ICPRSCPQLAGCTSVHARRAMTLALAEARVYEEGPRGTVSRHFFHPTTAAPSVGPDPDWYQPGAGRGAGCSTPAAEVAVGRGAAPGLRPRCLAFGLQARIPAGGTDSGATDRAQQLPSGSAAAVFGARQPDRSPYP